MKRSFKAMVLKGKDSREIAQLIYHYVENVTCIVCCNYYVEPDTAICGHTACHTCWYGRYTCPCCPAPLKKNTLKRNAYLQTASQETRKLVDAFEKLFNIKFHDILLDVPVVEVELQHDKVKNVNDWLCNSDNHFSVPPPISQHSTRDPLKQIELCSSKMPIHTSEIGSSNPLKVIHKPIPQDEWDKIEQLPDTEDLVFKNKENIIGPMDIEPFSINNNEYTIENPRRSSRKRENNNELDHKSKDASSKKHSPNSTTDIKTSKPKQNWNNVKKMKKEFSKLNKQNKNKLNVSIEKIKKTKSNISKPDIPSQKTLYVIEENTPEVKNNLEHGIKTSPVSATDVDKLNTSNDVPEENMNKWTNEFPQEFSANNISKIQNIKNNPTINLFKESTITNNDNASVAKVPFFKKGSLVMKSFENLENNSSKEIKIENINRNKESIDNEDIEIAIKIGKMIANITIKKKNNDVQCKINNNCGIQTSLESHLSQQNTIAKHQSEQFHVHNLENNLSHDNIQTNESLTTTADNRNKSSKIEHSSENHKTSDNVNGTLSQYVDSKNTKKNTESATTATGNFEITEGVEKEMLNITDVVEYKDAININNNNVERNQAYEENVKLDAIPDTGDHFSDVDIFYTDSVSESNVQLLKQAKNTPSGILMPTVKRSKMYKKKRLAKRDRSENVDEELPNKKLKIIQEENSNSGNLNKLKNNILQDTESTNYDAIITQVFANIDTDIEYMPEKSIENLKGSKNDKCSELIRTEGGKNAEHIDLTQKEKDKSDTNLKKHEIEKCSENVFSVPDESNDDKDNNLIHEPKTQKNITNIYTPDICENLVSKNTQQKIDFEMEKQITDKCGNTDVENEIYTPLQDNDDSDKSIVEETPQKSISFSKTRQKNEVLKKQNEVADLNKIHKSCVKNVTELLDTKDSTKNSNNDIVVEKNKTPHTLETPLTINKFVGNITHKSTPLARKSLNFDKDEENDLDQTFCPTSLGIAKTTQEKEFMAEAFERTPSPLKIQKALKESNINENKPFCVAGSCLTPPELNNVKLLCHKYKWTFTDKYTKDLTHLVVAVDEENKSQRSVKYLCAVSANKWIVSYAWVETCLRTNKIVNEEPFEAFDITGESGPKCSRTAKQKLFQGIMFYCLPLFSVLDVNTLKYMLQAMGGQVVDDIQGVRATEDKPAFLLAEPEQTQEDRFIYLAMEFNVVPVNYEWVLNCLGSYSLSSIHELLLCPVSILPKAVLRWPPALITPEDD